MAKAEKKKLDSADGALLPAGMQAKDLSVEKRSELYQQALAKFDKEATELYGMSVGVELKYTKQGIIPIMVVVDVLKNKENEKANPVRPEEKTTKA